MQGQLEEMAAARPVPETVERNLLVLQDMLNNLIENGLGDVPDATELVKGIAKISTELMAKERTDDSTIMSPLKVQKAIELLDGGDF